MVYSGSLAQKLQASASNLLERIQAINRADVQNFGKIATAAATTYFLATKIYDAFFGPLSCIPGPIALKFLPMQYLPNINSPPGTSWRKMKDWAHQYGDIVRVGPNDLMVSNKQMLKQILLTHDFPKAPVYAIYHRNGIQTLLDSTDVDIHKRRRRLMSSAFSTERLRTLEPHMAKVTEGMLRRIDKDIVRTKAEDGYGTVDIWSILRLFALDIIGETSYGTELHMLENSNNLVMRTINENIKMATFAMAHPILGKLAVSFPFLSGILMADNELQMYMRNMIKKRLESDGKQHHNDIIQILLNSQLNSNPENHLTLETITQETVVFWIAGSETTANTMGFAIINLLKHPKVLNKLRKEIDGIDIEVGQQLLRHQQLKHLPYLNAVINEVLRLDPIGVAGTDRIADKDVLLDGHIIVPKGTVFNCIFYHTHIDPAYWPEPEKFIPERWLDGSSIPADKDAFLPFTIGSRTCIGNTFALQEMRLAIANLVRLYDIQAIPEQIQASEDRRVAVFYGVHDRSFNVLFKRRAI
ncbi:cytochrome P450 [Fennellomyces sp. T-0311]|nr:cytochrome P450 [Fennellomyces sp. T-0311]